MRLIHVVPIGGHRVRNPDNSFAPLPEAGDTVQDSPYWRRKAREGAVTITPMN